MSLVLPRGTAVSRNPMGSNLAIEEGHKERDGHPRLIIPGVMRSDMNLSLGASFSEKKCQERQLWAGKQVSLILKSETQKNYSFQSPREKQTGLVMKKVACL